jgi:hypothetical protein
MNSRHKFITIKFFLIFLTHDLFPQAPSIQWTNCYGGSNDDVATSIIQTADDGYIVSGNALSFDGNVIGNHGSTDEWIIKLDTNGQLQWQISLGGNYGENGWSIHQINNGNYLVAGLTRSNTGDVSGNHGGFTTTSDFWITELDTGGTLHWQKCFGGTLNDVAFAMDLTNDSGCVIAGSTNSNDSDVTGFHGGTYDCWVIKIDSIGNLQWQKTLGGSIEEQASAVTQTLDGGYIAAGYSYSNDDDVSGNHGNSDCWIVKLNYNGILQWQKCLGGTDDDHANAIVATTDDGCIIAGFSESNDGDVNGNHGNSDYWIVKLDSIGNLQWQKCYGGSNADVARSIQRTNDGGYIIAGNTLSNDSDVSGNHGGRDFWIVKIDSIGNLDWQKTLGGSNEDGASSIRQTFNGGYVVAGFTKSNDGDVTGNHSTNNRDDYWIVKLSPLGLMVPAIEETAFTIYPNPGKEELQLVTTDWQNAFIKVSNITGEEILRDRLTYVTSYVDISKLMSGMYFITLQTETSSVTRRFVKQ